MTQSSHRAAWPGRAGALLLLLLATCGLPPAHAAPAPAPPDSLHAAMEAAVAIVKPALVRIQVVSANYVGGREIRGESFGSGVIITKDGHIVTNHHVAGDALAITCTMADKEIIEAELVGTDPLTDIAIIKLKPAKPRTFPFVTWGDSDTLKVGDRVFAMGSPLAFSQSVTMGIVSNTELVTPEIFGDSGPTIDGEDVASVVRWIGHDAQILPGNSGGPLVNVNGQIVGINEILLGLSGAIPGNLARTVAEQIVAQQKVTRSWMGLSVQPLFKSLATHGALVTGATPGSPAAVAGFLPGDILVRLAGKPVDVRFKEELPLFNVVMLSQPVGQEVEAVVLRGGKEIPLRVTPTEWHPSHPKQEEFKQWGLCASTISPLYARENRLDATHGILVDSVRQTGPTESAKPALAAEDIILEVAGKSVDSLADFRRVTDEISAGKTEPTPVLVAFTRKAERLLTVVKVGIPSPTDQGREVRKAWLPISMQVLTEELAEALGLEQRAGVRVTQLYPNAAVEKAGLQVGDIITAVDGTPVEASQEEDSEVLPAMIRQYPIGSAVELTVLRAGKEQKLTLELPAAPPQQREMKRYRDDNFEFAARDIAFLDRVREGWSEQQAGVLVESVTEGGWASLGRLATGDVVTAIDNTPIANVEALQAAMTRIATARPTHLIVQVNRGLRTVFLEWKAGWKPNEK